jgi:hypothetical protein
VDAHDDWEQVFNQSHMFFGREDLNRIMDAWEASIIIEIIGERGINALRGVESIGRARARVWSMYQGRRVNGSRSVKVDSVKTNAR